MTKSKRNHSDVDETSLTADEIIKIVSEMRDMDALPKDRARYFKNKYPDFVERYPMLFEMACQTSFDMERFEYMINLKMKIDKKEDTVENASKEVGQKLFDTYVKPKI